MKINNIINRETDKKWLLTAEELFETQSKIRYLKESQAKLTEYLQGLSDYASSEGGGYQYKFHKRPGPVDYKKIPELENIDLGPYRKDDVTIWKLSFTKQYDI